MINYTPFGHSDWQTIVSDIKTFGSTGKKTAVVSTINGDANVPFYKELANQGIKAEDIPVVAFSVGEEELAGFDTTPLVGHLAAWNYFQSVDVEENEAFISAWQTFMNDPDKRSPMTRWKPPYIGFNIWVEAVEKAGTTDHRRRARLDHRPRNPQPVGRLSTMMLPNHHLTKPVLIGEIQADGQFEVVSDVRPRPRRRVVRLPARIQDDRSRLDGPDLVRQLQYRNQDLRRRQLSPPAASDEGGLAALVFRLIDA
jgi:urea transport system substrate-binding protein